MLALMAMHAPRVSCPTQYVEVANLINQGPGAPADLANTTLDMGHATASHVRVTISLAMALSVKLDSPKCSSTVSLWPHGNRVRPTLASRTAWTPSFDGEVAAVWLRTR